VVSLEKSKVKERSALSLLSEFSPHNGHPTKCIFQEIQNTGLKHDYQLHQPTPPRKQYTFKQLRHAKIPSLTFFSWLDALQMQWIQPSCVVPWQSVPTLNPQPVPMLDFSRQYAPLRQEVLSALTAVCDSQHFILGPQVAAFEKAAAAACAARHAIGCASGTDALWLALAACGIGDSTASTRLGAPSIAATGVPGERTLLAGVTELWVGSDAVVTTPFSFFATASSILRAGARPLFADIDPRTFNLSPNSVAEVLASPAGKNVKAVLPVHLYGQCADWDAFAALQRDHPGLLLIEDAAQAFGASWTTPGQPAGRPAGSLGDAAAFSFYPTKNLAAMGDAGLVTTSSTVIDRRARSLRAHGMTRRYFHDEVGCNSRMDDLQAAVLNVKLRHIDEWNQQRRTRAARYDQLFREANLAVEWSPPEALHSNKESGAPSIAATSRWVGSAATIPSAVTPSTKDGVVLPYTDPRATPVFHQYVIRAPRRDALRARLTAQQIGSEIYYPVPIHLQAALRDLGHKPGDFPQAERAAAEVLALPLYPELRDDEQQTVVAAIRTFYA
jgi:dTDP-4-amino-4,6-dideoxygalactose transaminase